MNRTFYRKPLALALAAILIISIAHMTVFAAVETADFEGLSYTDEQQIPETATIDGFRFATATHEGVDYMTGEGAGGSAGLIAHWTSGPVAWVEFRREDNAAFALTSIYFNNTVYPSGVATACEIQGYYGESQVETMSGVSLTGTGTISFSGWDQVDRVRIVATAGDALDLAAAFDDIVYEIVSASTLPYMDTLLPLNLVEGGTAAISNTLLKAGDNDSDVSGLEYTVTAAPAHGRLENPDAPGVSLTTFTQGFIDSGKLRYVHDDSDTTNDSFVFSVSDGSHILTNQTFNITITPVYDPILPEGATVAAFDELTYSDAYQIPYTMPINGFLFNTPGNTGMQYYDHGAQDNTPGLIPYGSGDIPTLSIIRSDGSDFRLFSIYIDGHAGWGSDTYKFEGYRDGGLVYTKNNVNISTAGIVTFDDWTEDVDELLITAITGTNPDIRAYIDNIIYKPGALNPVPYISINQPVTVSEGGTVSITNSILKAADNDSEVSTLQFTITSAPSNGRVENSDNPGVAITTFTQGNIDSGKIHYVHNHSDTLSDSFVFKVSDGTNELTGQTFQITVTPVYDDPIPDGATVATFDNLGGIYLNGAVISAGTPVDAFLFSASDGSGMIYYNNDFQNIGQDNTACLAPSNSGTIENLTIVRSNGANFKLYSMYLYDRGTSGSSQYTFEGYLDGSKVYTKTGQNVKSPVTVTFNWDNLDEIRVIAQGAGPNIKAVFDNIVYQNNNNIPSDITLTNSAVEENAASGTTIGTFSTTDPDVGDTFTYALVSGTGSTDNSSFTIDGNTLKLGDAALDYESKSSLSIRIRTTDAEGAIYEKVFAITLTDVYETLAITTNSLLSLIEDASPAIIDDNKLETAVNVGLTATYTITAVPLKGTLKKDGIAVGMGGTFTQADINADKITYTPDADANGADSFSFSVSDGTNTISGQDFSVSITAVNDTPTVSGLPAGITVTEDVLSNFDLADALFGDVDGDALTVTLTASAGTINASSGGSVTVAGSGTGTLALSGTADNINAFLDTALNIQYIGAVNASGDNAAAITVNTSDGTVDPVLGTVMVDISAVNDDPSIAALVSDITVEENAASNLDLSDASFSDVDSGSNTITLILTVNTGILSASSAGGVTVTGSGTASLTLSGTAADIDAYLNTASNIKYTGPSGVSGNNAAILSLAANDGGYTGSGGGTDVVLGTVNIDITEAAPTVTNVSSTKADGIYGIDEVIEITVTFTKAVTVTGTPQLTLETGGIDRSVNYASGSGTNVLTFTYTVQSGDESVDLDYTSTGALALNGGTIKTSSGTSAVLILPIPGAAGSLAANKEIVIDTVAPSAPSTPDLTAGSDSGISDTDNITNDTTPTFTGTAEANSTVTLYSSVSQIGSTTADGSGIWSFTSVPLTSASHTITAKATDGAGNISALSAGLTISIDTTAPSATVSMDNTTLAAGETCGVTFIFSEAITGFTNAELTIDNGSLTTVSSTDGGVTYTATFTADSINDDTNTISVNLTGISDIAGNAGAGTAASANYTIIIPTAPGAPTVVTAVAGDTQATISFTAPAYDGGAAITGYTVTSNPGGITATGTASPITVTGLTNGTAYTFTVTATNSEGTGPASEVSNSITPKAAQTITFNNPGPQNFGTSPTMTATASSALTVTFTSTTPDVCSVTSNGILTFLKAGTATITAHQPGDNSFLAAPDVSQSFTVNPVVPGAPTDVTATTGDRQATVSFTAPVSDGGAAITGYTVTTSPGGITVTGTVSPITITGLTNGTAYTFTVTATSSAGTGTASAASNIVTPAALTYTASISPAGKTFTAAMAGYSQQDAQEFTIENTGTAIITGLMAQLGGTDFEISTALSTNSLNSGSIATVSIRPKTGLSVGNYNDTLTITGNNGISLTVSLSFTVNAASPTVTGVTVDPTTVSVQKGNTQTFTATVNGTNGPAQTVTWSVSGNTSTGTAISVSGVLTVASDEAAVTLAVTATSTVDNSKSGSATVTVTAAPVTTYTITATAGSGGSISPSGAVNVIEGSSQTFTITPGSGYRVSSVVVDGVSQGPATIYTFTNVTTNHTINATFTGTGGGGGGYIPSTPTYKAEVKEGNGSKSDLPVTVNKNSRSAVIAADSMSLTPGGTVITAPSIPDIDNYSVGLPVTGLVAAGVNGTLTFDTEVGIITVRSNMLTGIKLPEASPGISGKRAEITIGEGDKSALQDNVKTAIGDRPLVQLTLSIDGKQTDWSNPNTAVTVSIPYKPTALELVNPDSIVIWYIDGSGNVIIIPNGHYNAATGMVTFDITHFSYYAVAYNNVSFKDVPEDAWYKKAVSFISAREITSGTGNGKFSPEANLTRGQFIVLMMKAYNIAPDTNFTNNFSDAGNTFYTGYLAAAKRLGITAGVGNNMYSPDKEITRQEMFTLLYNALKVMGQLPKVQKLPDGSSGMTLESFTDAGQIDSWAKEAMTLMVETGIAYGNTGRLTPLSATTRADMAQVLYNLLGK